MRDEDTSRENARFKMRLQNTNVHVIKRYIIRLGFHQFVPFLIDTLRLDQRVK